MGSEDIFWFKKKGKLEREKKLIKEYSDSLLIVCEGGQTEPNYFKSFQTSGVKIKIIGKGKNTTSLVNDAIKEWKKSATEGIFFERLWCVFDRDDFPQEYYNQAFESVITEEERLNHRYRSKTGRNISIKIAYSNEAFELWFLLHFDYHTTGYKRHQYKKLLSKRLNKKYKKNDPNIYNDLLILAQKTNNIQGQNFALKNALKLRKRNKINNSHNINPSTSVDQLVIELNKHLKK